MFVTNTARSGSYLISMMMSANDDVMVASEPYLELFRSLRNAIVRHQAPLDLQRSFNPSSPIQDYYFTDDRIRIMDVISRGSLDVPFDSKEWESLLERSKLRVALQCAELVPFMRELKGATYKQMFDNAFEVIVKARDVKNRKWLGIKDAWTIEFFEPLARAYPEARFIVILRDPRAVINSMLGVVRIDPLQVGHALSFARHWRKFIAFTIHYQKQPLFKNRFFALTHEQFLRAPEKTARALCDFLEVTFDERMLDTSNYFDYATGGVWKGNSSFEEITSGISMHRAERWRSNLEERVVKMVDFTCEPDMRWIGYEPVFEVGDRWPDPEILDYLVEANQSYTNWRSDLQDPQKDYGFEMFRRALLTLPTDRELDGALVRRSFLFENVFEDLRKDNRSPISSGLRIGETFGRPS